MLYKKYHKNFVSQFKEGTEFNYKAFRDVVEREPHYDYGSIHIVGNTYYLPLVYHNGRINCNIKIEKDAVQEIS